MKLSTRILIADDHPLFREALRHVIDASISAADITEVRSYADAVGAVTDGGGPFDLMFFDLIMPGSSDPLAALAALRRMIPQTPILIVSSRDDDATAAAVLALGAAGFIAKSAPITEMERAIRRVLADHVNRPAEGSSWHADADRADALSPRQTEVLAQLARGRSNREIAADLSVEEFTVKAHISAILRKLHVKSRLAAVVVSRSFAAKR